MTQLTYISNNCTNISFYFTENREYDHPFIGSLFVNDKQYVKFCKNFSTYLDIDPIFGEPSETSTWALQNGGKWYKHPEIPVPYPVMYLGDVEIHWIHEKDRNVLMEKYIRRRERLRNSPNNTGLVFLLSVSDLCNDHLQEEYSKLIREFLSIPTSLYLTKYSEDCVNNRVLTPTGFEASEGRRVRLVKRWVGSSNERNESHILKIHTLGDRMDDFKELVKEFTTQRPKDVLNSSSKAENQQNVFDADGITSANFSIEPDDVVIAITSVIHVSKNPLYGVPNRSNISPQDRYLQTIEQLDSVREKIPKAKIFLLEMSEIIPDDELIQLSKRCDYVIKYGKNDGTFPAKHSPFGTIYHYCNESPNKGLGEMSVLIHLGTVLRDVPFRIFCKLNGRGKLGNSFNINNFLAGEASASEAGRENVPVFCAIKGGGRLGILTYSNFYSIPRHYFNLYVEHMIAWLFPHTNEPVEHILTMFAESVKMIKLIPKLGVDGYRACDREYLCL